MKSIRVLGSGFSVVTLLLVSAVLLSAQTTETTETPETVARQIGAATKAGDWAGFTKIMHPEELAKFKRLFRPIIGATGEKLGEQFFGVQTQAAYDELSDSQAFERFMRGMLQQAPDVMGILSTSEMVMLGRVDESPELSHVVYRVEMKVEGVLVSKISVMSLKKHAGTWRGLLTAEIEGLANAFASRTGK
jgi:hypothetical protein